MAATIGGYFVLNATIVQGLGLIARLESVLYLVACLAVFALSSLVIPHVPHRGFGRGLGQLLTLWIARPPFGMGYVMAALFAALVVNSAHVEGIDSVSLHGPLIVGWIQDHRIDLLWRWNYPLCAEYQFASNLLLMKVDTLIVLPRALCGIALVLLVRELGSSLRLPGIAAQSVAWLAVLTPVFWGVRGEGSLKSDGWFAVGILLAVCALYRASKGLRGSSYLVQLALFLLLGSKMTGFLYGGLLLSLFLATQVLRKEASASARDIGLFCVLTLAVQVTAVATLLTNWWVNGSPVFPIELRLGPVVVFPGATLQGTSILENAAVPGALEALLRSSSRRVGAELPVCFALFVVGLIVTGWRLSFGQPAKKYLWPFLLSLGVLILWGLFAATPWSAGRSGGDISYLLGGLSLRYALAPLLLTVLLAAAFIGRLKFRRWTSYGIFISMPLLFLWKWRPSIRYWFSTSPSLVFLIVVLIALGVGMASRVSRPRARRRTRGWIALSRLRNVAVVLLLLLMFSWTVEVLRPNHWGRSSRRTANLRPIWRYLGSEVRGPAVLSTNAEFPLYAYFLYGSRFQHRVVTAASLQSGDLKDVQQESDYILLSLRPQQVDQQATFIRQLSLEGWRVVVSTVNREATLLARSRDTAE